MRSDEIFLEHIRNEVEFILENTDGLSYQEFLGNLVLKKAVVQSFSVIGEAANQISEDFQKQHPEFDWKGMTGFRNRLIHKYFDINFSQVWEIIEEDIPKLYELLLKI